MQFALSGTQFDIFRQAEQTTRTLFLQHTFEAFSAHLWWTLHVRLMGEIFKSYLGTHIITTVITAVPLSSWFLKWTKLGKHTVHIVWKLMNRVALERQKVEKTRTNNTLGYHMITDSNPNEYESIHAQWKQDCLASTTKNPFWWKRQCWKETFWR